MIYLKKASAISYANGKFFAIRKSLNSGNAVNLFTTGFPS